MMNRNLRPNRSNQHSKEGIKFSFEDVEKKNQASVKELLNLKVNNYLT